MKLGALALVLLLVASTASAATWNPSLAARENYQKRRPAQNFDEGKVAPYVLPDLFPPGTSAQEWRGKLRPAWIETIRREMFGQILAPAGAVRFEPGVAHDWEGGAGVKRKAVEGVVTIEGKSLNFRIHLFYLANQVGRAPVMLLLNNRAKPLQDPKSVIESGFFAVNEILAAGFIAAIVNATDFDPDSDAGPFDNGLHALLEKPGPRPPDAPATLAAWAWGASRVMDYLASDPLVDPAQVALVGHSRGGKAALWAAALDERFALVVSNQSGCAGAALSRRDYGESVAALNERYPHWFNANFKRYSGAEDQLPFDQHTLLALIAPRGLYVASADEDLWSDPRGEYLAVVEAAPAFELFGYGDRRDPPPMPPLDTPVRLNGGRAGYHVRSGSHTLTPYDWKCFGEFAQHLFRAPHSP